MRVKAVNGSPKATDSTSERIIKQVERLFGYKIEVYRAKQLIKEATSLEIIQEILNSDALLIVFPLYVDSLPAPLIELLTMLESASEHIMAKPKVYAIVNAGFFEAEQNKAALEMIEHFAKRLQLPWGYGIGIGGGGMLSSMGDDWSKGPVSGIYHEIAELATAIRNNSSRENIFISPKIPRLVYKLAADLGMRRIAKQSGVKNIRARPYTE